MEKRNKKLAKNTAILSMGVLCTKGIMFFMAPLFTRWLSSADYGTFDLLVSYVSLFLPLSTLSAGEAMFRFLLDADSEDTKRKLISTVSVLYFCGLMLAVIGGCAFLKFTSYTNLVIVSFVWYLGADILYNFCMSSMRGLKKLHFYTIGNISFVLVMAVSVFVFVRVLSLGLSGILMGYAVGNMTAALIMICGAKLHTYFRLDCFSRQQLRPLLKYAVPMIPNAVSWWIINVFDRTLVTAVLGASMNGIYAIANKIPNLCYTFLNVFHLSWQQSATEALSDDDRDKYYTQTVNKLATLVISICTIVMSLNYFFFKLLFPEEYFVGYYHAPILICSIIFFVLSQFVGGIYVACKESIKNGRTTVIGAVTAVVFNILLIRIIGLYAASISTLLAYAVLFVIRWIDIRRNFNIFFEKATYIYAVIFLYFFTSCYFNHLVLSIVNVVLAMAFFVTVNRKYVAMLIKKFMQR